MESAFTYYLLSNLSLVLFFLALIFATVSVKRQGHQLKHEVVEEYAGYFFFFNVGIFCLWSFLLNLVASTAIADLLGWGAIPFRTQDMAFNLGLGIAGLLAIRENYTFRLATLIITTAAFWGHAIEYGNMLLLDARYQLGFYLAKSNFYIMVLVPIILIVLMGTAKKK